jgi:predicted CXXCH cytochrome family protein
LNGKHSEVACQKCHDRKGSFVNYHPKFESCTNCHKDAHAGQFAARYGDKCETCHTLDGFDRPTFDVRAHISTRYALAGKHSEVACQKCHDGKGSFVNYHPKFESCTNCHKDAHAGQFAARYGDKCETCHVVDGFLPATFTLARHRETRFALAGAHIAVTCADCHTKSGDRNPHLYVFEDRSCVGCHRDPHQLSGQPKQCETCHTLNSWRLTRGFDHNTTRFPLLGSHRTTGCVMCHKPAESPAGKEIVFTGAPQQCSGCHEDTHAGQFARRFGADDCSSCHSTARWKPSGFDHARTVFRLDGAHRNVQCAGCHDRTSRVSGRDVLVYRETPTECAKCH